MKVEWVRFAAWLDLWYEEPGGGTDLCSPSGFTFLPSISTWTCQKMWNFPDTYFIFYYPPAKLRIMRHVTTVVTVTTVTLTRRTRSSLTSRFVLIRTERSTGSRLTIDDGKDEGREGKGSQQPRERSTYSLNSDLWPLNNSQLSVILRAKIKISSPDRWREALFFVHFLAAGLRVTDSRSYRPDSRHLTNNSCSFYRPASLSLLRILRSTPNSSQK